MQLPQLGEGREALPRRIFLEGNRKPLYDQDGFVLRVGEALSLRHLLEQSAVLAVAPPWTGKTFLAKQLAGIWKEDRRPPSLSFLQYFDLISFERFGRSASIVPQWWDEWRRGDQQACLLIDAVDEDERRGDRRCLEILDRIEELKNDRSRLHLLVFARLNEIPVWLEERLVELYGVWSLERPQGLRRVRLAGLDREEARLLVGWERFDHVRELIHESGLKSLASYPAVLEHLKDREAGQKLTQEAIWQGVLMDLLHRPERWDRPAFRPLETERFEVAQRLAAITTFCEDRDLRLDVLGREGLLPSRLPGLGDLRVASREVVRSSLFEPTDGGFRFAQDHVREWLAAFALRDMSLLRVRPLLSLESGEVDPRHEGVMGFLRQITRHPEVRNWIIDQHQGLPDPDSVPLSFQEARDALDQLQGLARTSPWGLRVWERLAALKVEGIGTEIGRRLRNPLQPAEQQFLLDVALVVEAEEALDSASRLIRETGQDVRVKAQAASFVAQLGTKENLQPLCDWWHTLTESDRQLKSEVLSTLGAAFFEKGLWSFETAADVALSPAGLEASWLQYRLAENLSLERARWLMEHVLDSPGLLGQPLAEKAIDKILEPEELSESAVDLILPLQLRWDEMQKAHFGLGNRILRKIGTSRPARRRLFRQGLLHDSERRQGHGIWANVLEGEDTRWLLDLVEERGGEPDWLWMYLYFVSRWPDVQRSLRQRVRDKMRAVQPELLKQLDRQQKKLAQFKSRERLSGEAKLYELSALVREILDSEELRLHHKMLRLSQCCFVPPSRRPSNLSGAWEDLSEELRREILGVCRQALDECPPMEVLEGSSFSSGISWEADCFNRLVEAGTVVPTPELIKKWLPAILRTWESEYKSTLRRCFEVSRDLSEDMLLQEARREMRSGATRIYIIQEVPPELWSERLSILLEDLVQRDETQAEARIDLLTRIGRMFPRRARSIASLWADGEDLALRDAGIDLLLMVEPQEGWTRLKALSAMESPALVLRRMRSLHPKRWWFSADLTPWPASLLGELEILLFEGFPPEIDPQWEPGEVRALGADDDLRSLRDKIPALLYKRELEGDRAVLEALANVYPRIREWLDDAQTQQGVQGVLSGLGTGRLRPRGKLLLEQMVKLLQDSWFRILRTNDDLQDLILEELRSITKDAKRHLSMLYHPRPRRTERLHEDALQAYLHSRLSDRLIPRVLDSRKTEVVFIDRETLGSRDERNDLKVQANSVDNSALGVIIEIKWSDHPEVSTSQVEQLGTRYLLKDNNTHGIYLVGWSGQAQRWKGEGSAPEPKTGYEAWQMALEEQARSLCAEHPDLRIIPFVMDLSWEEPDTA